MSAHPASWGSRRASVRMDLDEFDLGCAGTLSQRGAGHCLSVVGIGRIPAKGIGQPGRFSTSTYSPTKSGRALERLHRDPISAAHPHVQITSGQVDPSGPHHSAT